ncbi:aminopeptidase P family protein [bacterium]|nr:aminopeptidase P family protein [candidate division CSSED10-310 bacterium]
MKAIATRLKELLLLIQKDRRDAIVLLDIANIRYITGLNLAGACVVLNQDSIRIFTDITNYSSARMVYDRHIVHCSGRSPWVDALLWLKRCKVMRCRVDPMKIPLAFYLVARQINQSIEWVDAGDSLSRIRAVKDQEELNRIREAAAVSGQALLEWTRSIQEGISEKQAATRMDQIVIRMSNELPCFPSMVAFGENTAFPHWSGSDRTLQPGDTILIDWGARSDGYGSDFTRVFFWKKATNTQLRRYHAVRITLANVIQALRSSMKTSEIDGIARSTFAEFGLKEYFVHPLGHGVGLELHEPPYFCLDSGDELVINMVAALEPGIFVPGWGGIRLEETVCIRVSGAETLAIEPVREQPILSGNESGG